jgi:Peptidase family M28
MPPGRFCRHCADAPQHSMTDRGKDQLMNHPLRRVLLIVIACVIAIAAQVGLAQQPSAAQATPAAQGTAPARQGAPGRGGRGGFGERSILPPVVIPDAEYIKWVLTPEQKKYSSIDGLRMKKYIHEMVAFSMKSKADGNQNWGRHAGTIYDKMNRDWAVAQFRRLGLEEIRDQPITQAPRFWPESWEASVVIGGKATPLKTSFALGGESTPASGVELPIVWVGLGTEADFAGRDVKGKAVLVHAMPTPTRRENSAIWLGVAARARTLGAQMLIVNLAIPGMPDVTTKPGTGGGGEDAPADSLTISLGSGETEMIRKAIGAGQTPTIRYRQTIVQKGGPTGVVLAKLSGTTDEWIGIEAHTDGDFQGALDNASGVAQLVEMAEYFSKVPRAQRRRNILFVVHSDHHSGSAGLRWIDQNMSDVQDKMVANFVTEHPSQTQVYYVSGSLMTSDMSSARRIGLGGANGTPLYRDIVLKGLKAFGVATYSRPDGGDGSGGNGFSTSPPRVRLIDHTFYHTDMDVPEWVPANGLGESTMALASILDEFNKHTFQELRRPVAKGTSREQ